MESGESNTTVYTRARNPGRRWTDSLERQREKERLARALENSNGYIAFLWALPFYLGGIFHGSDLWVLFVLLFIGFFLQFSFGLFQTEWDFPAHKFVWTKR